VQFLFVLDEWDFIFHRSFVTKEDKEEFISFLSNLLKDKPYVSLAYMTGILPISKYSSGSELNMFLEYTMVSEEKFSDCFGFTEKEVDHLLKDNHLFGDHTLLRRWLCDYGMMNRTVDCREYRRVEKRPPVEALELIRHVGSERS
jgi:hypothetical protein